MPSQSDCCCCSFARLPRRPGASRETFLTLLVFAECPGASHLPCSTDQAMARCRRTEMRGDWVGTPRRANPTADTHVASAQRHGPIRIWVLVEGGKGSRKRAADICQTCRV